jgi:hypothetical protein
MRKIRVLLGVGVWIAVLPYLGFPYSWKNILLTLSGIGLVYLSFLMYRESKAKGVQVFDNFSENTDFGK